MTEKIRALLPDIQNLSIFSDCGFKLIGGTALSYHLDHRLSEDLDFCTLDMLPREAIDEFIEYCIDKFGEENIDLIPFVQGKLVDFETHCEDISDYEQNWMIKGVKVTFFNGSDAKGIRDVFRDDKNSYIGNIEVASVDSIFKLKSLMFYSRAKARDYFDLLYLYDHDSSKFNIENTIALIHEYELAYRNFDLFFQKIEYPNYNKDFDEPLYGLVDMPKDFFELNKIFKELLLEFKANSTL